MTTAFQSNAFQNNAFQIDGVTAAAHVTVPQGGSGGGSKWERVSTSDGAKPGQLSVREQNLKEIRELEAIEREIARQEQITAEKVVDLTQAAIDEIRSLRANARSGSEQVTAMAAAFERAGLVLPVVEPLIDEDEEEILLLLMATLH